MKFIFRHFVLVTLSTLIGQISYAAAPEPEIHRLTAEFKQKNGDWVAKFDLPNATNRFSIALRLERDIPYPGLILRTTDANGVPLASAAAAITRGEERIASNKGAVHITPRFIAPIGLKTVHVRIIGSDGPQPPFQLLSGIVDVGTPTLVQSLVYDGSLELCKDVPMRKKLGQSVARLSIPTGTGAVSYCTGFAIGNNHLLTNHHCLAKFSPGDSCKRIQIEFNYSCASQRIGVVQPECVRIIPRQSQELDYAVIEFKLAPGEVVQPLEPARAVPGKGLPFLLHHSAGTAMRSGTTEDPIATIGNSAPIKQRVSDARAACTASVYSVDDQFLEPTSSELRSVITHSVNTTGGASGAPVFIGNKVVGLHFDRDRRYYPKSGCFDAGVENCMTRRLGLPNWAVQVCDVLSDISPSIQGIRRCGT